MLWLLASGALTAVPGCTSTRPGARQAMAAPAEMGEGQSIFRLVGDVSVNQGAADLATQVLPGDVVETGEDAEAIFVVDDDAFLLRANSRMLIPPNATVGYTLGQGKALGVFASKRTQIRTPSAVISIRGTGVYVEVEPTLSYVCLCYGAANLATADMAQDLDLETEHHDAPKYILADANASNRIEPAPFKNHSDQELLLIETLVGRSTPYVVPQGLPRTRRRYL